MKGLIEIYIIGASEVICKWILLIFFKKVIYWERGKYNFFGKEINWKVVIMMHSYQTEVDIPPKITIQPEFCLLSLFSLVLMKGFLKTYITISLSTKKYGQDNKKVKYICNKFFFQVLWPYVYFFKSY